ncbi:ABC transporter permease [Paenibacillus agaridevorans]|uniref:ABC transporter permease n=1 Tax=Paenibacillus agaridevorans TaxID=171404 RepID=UPI001FE24A51|nr:ABC transporter permease subunit [Paenibacillus agaridevorans]
MLPLWLMVLPGMMYLLINNYIPMLGVFIAFKKIHYSKPLWLNDWAGFDNFTFLFASPDAYIILRNTLLYNSAFIFLNLIFALFIAVMLNELKNKLLKKSYQSILLLPYLLSFGIVGYLVYAFLSVEHGFINTNILSLFGIQPIEWYMNSEYWPYILLIVQNWKTVGYLSVIYLAAIVGINNEYYEAAYIDGANKWSQITKITIPLIKPVIVIMTLLAIGRIFYADFGLFYQVPMNTGRLLPTTNVIDTYVYRALIQTGDVGMSAAAGLFQSVLGFFLVLVANFTVRKIDKDNALF